MLIQNEVKINIGETQSKWSVDISTENQEGLPVAEVESTKAGKIDLNTI